VLWAVGFKSWPCWAGLKVTVVFVGAVGVAEYIYTHILQNASSWFLPKFPSG
jgi:hypothetical protein